MPEHLLVFHRIVDAAAWQDARFGRNIGDENLDRQRGAHGKARMPAYGRDALATFCIENARDVRLCRAGLQRQGENDRRLVLERCGLGDKLVAQRAVAKGLLDIGDDGVRRRRCAVGVLLDARLGALFQIGLRLAIELAIAAKLVDQRARNEDGDAAHRAQGKRRAHDERQVPGFDGRGFGDDAVQRFLADLGIGICQQLRDGRDFERGDDGIGKRAVDAAAARYGFERALHACRRDDFEKVLVGEQRRIFEHRAADRLLHIMGERDGKALWHIGAGFDFLGNDLAHAHKLVLCETFEQHDDAVAHIADFRRAHVGHDAGDLSRKFGAHFALFIGDKIFVGLNGRRGICGDEAAHAHIGIACEIVERFGRSVGARGKLALHIERAAFQCGACVFIKQPGGQLLSREQSFQEAKTHRKSPLRQC